jgi:hypothetical protein
MTKIIQFPSKEIYYIKAILPYYEEMSISPSEESPYRIIAAIPGMSLYDFGLAVLEAFDFDADHLFGFYDNIRSYYSSKVCFEHPDYFLDDNEDWDEFGNMGRNKTVYSMDDFPISEIFTRKGKKWLMLFDYGDEWNFWLSLEKKVAFDLRKQYPFIVESKYDAPEQYPDYDEDDI